MTTLDGGPHVVTETAAAYSEAARRAREVAEQNHPARLLGVAQVAIETALRTNDLAEVHALLGDALDRIKPTEIPARGTSCTHPRTGLVTSHKPKLGLFEAAVHGAHAEAPVCDLPECIAAATAWVERMSRKPAYHVRIARKTEVPA